MGDMIRFGIKIGLIVSVAIALVGSFVILLALLPTPGIPASLNDVLYLFGIVFPLNMNLLFTLISGLIAFKLAYWAADKMILLIDALG